MDPGEQPDRRDLLARLDSTPAFDVAIIGGGATGLGVAVDAAARGFSVALLDRDDFASGTSSRATKLVHGGVRYLAQGHVGLVREALRERTNLLANAPHLVRPLPFLIPMYGLRGRIIDRAFYGAGLRVYDALAAGHALGFTAWLGRSDLVAAAPGVRHDRLVGGLRYLDAQFDDARLAVALARTAIALGAVVVNHCGVVSLRRDAGGRVAGVVAEDRETGRQREVVARCVVNAAGVWVDDVRGMDEPGVDHLLSPSQGAHVVVDRDVFPSASALLVPRTADGRVLFAVPWHGKVILGTTDTPRSDLPREPRPFAAEVNFILTEAARYLQHPPTREDVRSAWAGLRPLVKPAAGGRETRRISREHACVVSPRGLVTVTGGKWTTYRAMAEDVLARCFAAGILPARPAGVTRTLRLVGAPDIGGVGMSAVPGLHLYGTEADAVAALPGADEEILPGLTAAMVRFAARREYARTVADVLARRSRWLFLDAARATDAAARVAAILADERGGTFDAAAAVAEFRRLAAGYVLPP